MKISLIGYGFVGKAVHEVLKDHYDVKIIDLPGADMPDANSL